MKWKTEPCSAQQIMTAWKIGRVNTCTGECLVGRCRCGGKRKGDANTSKYDPTLKEMEEIYGPAHYSVYMIMFPNLKAYVGCTGIEPWRRWRGQRNLNKDIIEAYKKYGKENCSLFVLEDGLTEDEAYEREKYWIDFYDSRNIENGYNSQTGGLKGMVRSKRSIERYSKGAIKRYSDPAQREKDRMAQIHYPVICVETGERFESAVLAERKMGIHNAGINKVCRHKCKTAGGYHWRFAEENECPA